MIPIDDLNSWPIGLTDFETVSDYASRIEQEGENFDADATIPEDSIIVVNLNNGLQFWREYPVFLLLYSEEAAIFYVRDSIRAEASGSCMLVR